MIEASERVATSFALRVATAPKTLPAVARGGITEQFDELCRATTEYRSQLKDALDQTVRSRPPAVVDKRRPWTPSAALAWIPRALGLGSALGAGVEATEAPAVSALPAPHKETLEEVLNRVHDTQRFSPATLVALSTMAQERLDDRKQPLSAGVRSALAQTVWHGETQPREEIARSVRWVTLKRALDGVARFAHADHRVTPDRAYRAVHEAFDKLDADERAALAPVIRAATFEGEKPRHQVEFEVARDLHKLFWTVSPERVAPLQEIPAPEGAPTVARFGREVLALEEAIARAVDGSQRCIHAAARAVHERHDVYPGAKEEHILGMDAQALRSEVVLMNTTVDATAIGKAASRALAPWHTDLERAALALVAKRGLALLDLTCTLGSEARELLTAIAEQRAPESEELHEKIVDDATRLYKVLDTFNRIDKSTGTETWVADAIALFNKKVLPVEKVGLALAIREHVLEPLMKTRDYFPGSVTLHRELREIIEG